MAIDSPAGCPELLAGTFGWVIVRSSDYQTLQERPPPLVPRPPDLTIALPGGAAPPPRSRRQTLVRWRFLDNDFG
jgi:hypothetical protein